MDENCYGKSIVDSGNDLLLKMDVHNWNGLYRRDFLNENMIRHNTTPGASYQDTGFRFQYLTRGGSILFIHGPRYQYRVDNPMSSIRTNDNKVFAIVDEYSFIENYLENNGLIEKYGSGFSVNRYHSYKWNFNSISKQNKKIFVERWREELSKNGYANVKKGFMQKLDEWMVRNLPISLYIAVAGTAHDVLLKLGIISDV